MFKQSHLQIWVLTLLFNYSLLLLLGLWAWKLFLKECVSLYLMWLTLNDISSTGLVCMLWANSGYLLASWYTLMQPKLREIEEKSHLTTKSKNFSKFHITVSGNLVRIWSFLSWMQCIKFHNKIIVSKKMMALFSAQLILSLWLLVLVAALATLLYFPLMSLTTAHSSSEVCACPHVLCGDGAGWSGKLSCQAP